MRKKTRQRAKALRERFQQRTGNKISQALVKTDLVWSQLIRLLQAEYADDRRTMLLVGYTDLTFEHHQAIRQLVRAKLYGSAFALVRVLYDAFFRAHWMLKCASDEQVEEIATSDDFKFPKIRPMVQAIDEAYQVDTYFSDLIGDGTLAAMHSYTHSGLRQLTRRFTGHSVEPNYGEKEVLEVLNSTTIAICLMARLLTFVTGRLEQGGSAERIMVRFAQN